MGLRIDPDLFNTARFFETKNAVSNDRQKEMKWQFFYLEPQKTKRSRWMR